MEIVFLLGLLHWGVPPQVQAQARPEPMASVRESRLRELSGLVASRRHPGVFWAHNDSGNPPELFALDRNGRTLARYTVAAPNIDWEDIAIDDRGHLFLGDIGNNLRALPLRVIHELEEPDPAVTREGRLVPIRSFFYGFEPGDRFDAESLFVDGADLVLVEKRLDGQEARLWSLNRNSVSSLLKPAGLKPNGRLTGFREPATGASLSEDGRWLAVCSTRVSRVYARTEHGAWALHASLEHPGGEQYEAVAWEGSDLILASESGRRDRWVDPCSRAVRRDPP